MKFKVPTKQLSAISLLSSVGAVLRVGFGWAAYAVPYVPLPFGFSLYGIFIKIGLTETLTFISGFAFGPVQGFLTGVLMISVSDIFSIYGPGPWTPFIAAIIGLLGICGGLLRRLKHNPSVTLLGVAAVTLTLMSEILQNIWFAWFFNMPVITALIMGVHSIVTAVVNNTVLFTIVAPRIFKVLQEWVMPKETEKRLINRERFHP